jgi:hypothetical protein
MGNPSQTRRQRLARRGLLPLVLGFALGTATAWAVGPTGEPPASERQLQGPPPPIRMELPREWRQVLPPPIRFDSMFRRDPDAIWR